MAWFASCTEEPATPNTSSNSSSTSGGITGIWNFVDLIQEDGKVTWNGETVSTYNTTSSNQTGTTEFKSDGSYISKIGYNYQTTQTINGETSVDNAIVTPVTTLGEYTFNSNTNALSTTTDGSTFVSTVTELTPNKLVIVLDVKSEQVANGITIVASNKSTTTYTR